MFRSFFRHNKAKSDSSYAEGTFCIHAFRSIEIMPTGTVKPCCAFAQHIQKNARDMSVYEFHLDEIWNSAVMQQVRQAMIEGEPVKDCRYCYRQEQQGLTSIRMHANKVFQQGYLNDDRATITEVKADAKERNFVLPNGPQYIEMAVGNLCNLKCRMCYTGYSSAIAADRVHSQWASSPSLARWNGLTAVVAPRRVIGASYFGLTDPEVTQDKSTSWTDGNASIHLDLLTESVTGFSIKLSPDHPPQHPFKMVANDDVVFDGVLPSGAWKRSFTFSNPVSAGKLKLQFRSPTFSRQVDSLQVGVGITELELLRAEKQQNTLAVSRFSGGHHWFQEPRFVIDEVLQHPDNVKRLYVIGGEPLLSKELRQVMHHLTKLEKSRNIALAFTTNATLVDEEWLILARQFKSVSVGISVDGVGAVNNYIRYPSQWDTIVKNIRRFRAERDFDVELAVTVQAYNVLYMAELVQFCLAEGVMFKFLFLDNPRHLNAFSMPGNILKEASLRLRKSLLEMNKKSAQSPTGSAAQELVRALEKQEDRAENRAAIRDFMMFTNDLDVTRNQKIQETLPELVQGLEIAGYQWISDNQFAVGKVATAMGVSRGQILSN